MVNTSKFNNLFKYDGKLGCFYSKDKTKFKLWAPTATEVNLLLFGKNKMEYNNKPVNVIAMKRQDKGVWAVEVPGDIDGMFYNYMVKADAQEKEVVDPYAKAVGVNGDRGMVVDFSRTNPEGWENDVRPNKGHAIDSVIYEMHIRDFSIDANSGVEEKYKGKYLGVIEAKTSIPGKGTKTCLEHLKELGVTTVHLMPVFDFATVDESKPELNQYNWGYDPKNYNVPEGSYSTDPYDGAVRIKEFKEMVMGLHKSGLRVVMDMVYNHTYSSYDSNLNKAVPNYYYRQDDNGYFSNGSGCGNELASERSMVRKFIVDSILYWTQEYHIDGFRFDLMGLEDIVTMKEIRSKLDMIEDDIIMYGEGWTGGWSTLSPNEAALKHNTARYGGQQIAAFDDNIRDGIKGHVFNHDEKGFINGQDGYEETIKFGVVAATYHAQVHYRSVDSSKEAWANEPYQCVTYASAHDNLTLWDKLKVSSSWANDIDLRAMNKLSAAIVFTCQGIPFIQAGEEFARTKVNPDGSLNENSYNAPDSVNKLDWNRKDEYNDVFEYYKGLINMRKNHRAFKMNTNIQIQDNLQFLDTNYKSVIAYTINGEAVKDDWKNIVVIYNGRREEVEVTIPEGKYAIMVNEKSAGETKLGEVNGNKVIVHRKSCYVLVKM